MSLREVFRRKPKIFGTLHDPQRTWFSIARACQSMPEHARACQSMPEHARAMSFLKPSPSLDIKIPRTIGKWIDDHPPM